MKIYICDILNICILCNRSILLCFLIHLYNQFCSQIRHRFNITLRNKITRKNIKFRIDKLKKCQKSYELFNVTFNLKKKG